MAASEKTNGANAPQSEAKVSTVVSGNDDYPEGGAKAWGVAIGTSLALFCSLGYVNSFG